MGENEKIMFATSWAVENFLVNPETVIDVGPFGDDEVVLQLRAHRAASQPILEPAQDWIFARCRLMPTRKQREMLRDLLPIIAPSVDEEEVRGDGINQERRRVRYKDDLAKSELLRDFQENIRPQLRELINRVSDILYNGSVDFLKLIRWRYGKDCNFTLPHRTWIFWEDSDGAGWRHIPSRPSTPGPLRGIQVGISKHDYAVDEVHRLLQTKQHPRVQYDLLCEARSFTTKMPQLSLIEAVQALEIGTKDAVSRLCESATWLAFEVPTPPILRVLADYIPSLITDSHVRKQFTEFIAAHSKGITKIVTQRNRVTHKGIAVDWEDAEFACDLVGDLLYKLDFACGVRWADGVVWRRADVMARLKVKTTAPDSAVRRADRRLTQ